jgi:ADP-ribosyl-[dinitrogen reductase] hydrolase
VALAHLDDPEALVEAARRVSALTHHDTQAGEACALWCLMIRQAVLTGSLDDVRPNIDLLPEASRALWAERLDEAEVSEPGVFQSNGWVVEALQAAWSAIVHTPVPDEALDEGSFACLHLQHALETAIRIGHDTDTVAAIAGALLGAQWGVSAIPAAWREPSPRTTRTSRSYSTTRPEPSCASATTGASCSCTALPPRAEPRRSP